MGAGKGESPSFTLAPTSACSACLKEGDMEEVGRWGEHEAHKHLNAFKRGGDCLWRCFSLGPSFAQGCICQTVNLFSLVYLV